MKRLVIILALVFILALTGTAEAKHKHKRPHWRSLVRGELVSVITGPIDCIPTVEPNCPTAPGYPPVIIADNNTTDG